MSAPVVKEGERIAKRLARAGLCSRRDAERWIAEGRVKVDGELLKTPACVVTSRSRIEVDGKPLPDADRARLWRYHKPVGELVTARDPQGRPTIFDALPKGMPRTIAVGRLDFMSEGLLLLTNDGELARKLESPLAICNVYYGTTIFPGTSFCVDFERAHGPGTALGLWDLPGTLVPDGAEPWYAVPVFSPMPDGGLVATYVRSAMLKAQRFPEVPRLTPQLIAACDAMDALANDPAIHLDMDFQPGDMQFVSNHWIMHSRTAYEDFAEPEQRRHLAGARRHRF